MLSLHADLARAAPAPAPPCLALLLQEDLEMPESVIDLFRENAVSGPGERACCSAPMPRHDSLFARRGQPASGGAAHLHPVLPF